MLLPCVISSEALIHKKKPLTYEQRVCSLQILPSRSMFHKIVLSYIFLLSQSQSLAPSNLKLSPEVNSSFHVKRAVKIFKLKIKDKHLLFLAYTVYRTFCSL